MNNERLKHKVIQILIDYIIDHPPTHIEDNSIIPWEVFINSRNERARCYLDILDIVVDTAVKQLEEEGKA